MSILFKHIRDLYRSGQITDVQVYIYVEKGLITQEEAELIIKENI